MGFWVGRSVLVTGAGGFIGSHLVEALVREGAKVTALLHYDIRTNRSNLEFIPKDILSQIEVVAGDICDSFYVNRLVSGKDTVFHLAALIAIPYSYIAPLSYIRTNVEGTLNVAEACRSHGTRCLVHTSTSEVYGTALYAPIDEKHPLQGQSPYSASKIGSDKIIESYVRSFDLRAVTLRPFNTYGPRQSARAVIPTIISQILSDNPVAKIGDKTPIRDMNFVTDTAKAFMAVAENEKCLGDTFNTGTGVGVTVGEIIDRVSAITGIHKEFQTDNSRVRPGKSEVFKLLATSEKLQLATSWRPRVSLDEGLASTIDFIKRNGNQFNVGKYEV